MSPIPSTATAFVLSTTPSVVDSSGQPPPVQLQYLFGTGGLLVAVVAIVSIAAYFSRGCGAAKGSGTSHPWTSGWSGLFATLRHQGSDTICNGAINRRMQAGLEAEGEHVNMVYAKYFHPTCWSPVECHSPTSSAPAIYVEAEAEEPEVAEPKPFGMNSFLDVDDDEGDDDDSSNGPREEPHRGERPRSKRPPPYDTSTSINVTFASDVIGTTARAGTFLSVLREPDEKLSNDETSSADFDPDFCDSPYDGTLMLPPGSLCSLQDYHGSSLEFDADCYCSAYGGIVVTPGPCCFAKQFGQGSFGLRSEFDPSYEAYGGIPMETQSGCQLEGLLAYDAHSWTHVNMNNGTVYAVPRSLPAIPEQLEDTFSESSSSDSDSELYSSPYAGIEMTPPPGNMPS